MQAHSQSFEEIFSKALDRALERTLGRSARVANFYVDPKMSVKGPDAYIELLKKIFSPELVNALVDAIGRELSKNLNFQFQENVTWKLSDYVSYARQPLELRLELELGSMIDVGAEKELKVELVNRTVNDMELGHCDLEVTSEVSLLEPGQAIRNLEGMKLAPGEVYSLSAKIRGTRVGKARISAKATAVDSEGQSTVIEVPYTLVVVERGGRLSTGSPIVDSLLLGGLPGEYAVLLTASACDEKDQLVLGFCAVAPAATVYVSSDVDRSREYHRLYPELRQVICSRQADLLPTARVIQISKSFENIFEINVLLMKALETIVDESPRIFLQLISDVLLLHKELATRHWLADLLPRLRARHCTILAELNLRMHETHEVNAIFDLFDGRLELLEREEAEQILRFLRVTNLRGQKYLPHQMLLSRQ